MVKITVKALMCISLGVIIGKLIFTNKKELINNKKDTYYFLQEGIYYDNDMLENNITKIIPNLIERENDKIYIYTGITKDLEVAEKIINIYEEENIKLSIKEKNITNEEFKNNIEQFDLLIKSSTDKDEIKKIEEVVLASYEEIIKNSITTS